MGMRVLADAVQHRGRRRCAMSLASVGEPNRLHVRNAKLSNQGSPKLCFYLQGIISIR